MICKFKQNEVANSNIGKSVEETSRGAEQHEQISNDAMRKSQKEKEEDVKESSPEKETVAEQISKKDATDLIDDQVKVTNNTLYAADALVNAVITNMVEVDEAPKGNHEGKPCVTIDDKNNCPASALISSLAGNKVVTSSNQENAESDDYRAEVIERACDDYQISRQSSQNNTLEEENRTERASVSPEEMNDDSDVDAERMENKKGISIGDEGLVRESSTDIEPDYVEDQHSEDVELTKEVQAELDKLDVFLDDEISNAKLTENQNNEEQISPNLTTEISLQDQNKNEEHTDNVEINVVPTHSKEDVLEKVTASGDQEVLVVATKNVNQDEKENANETVVTSGGQTDVDVSAEDTAKDVDDLSVESSTGDADAGSECQVGLEGCTFACVLCGSSKAHEPRPSMWMERHVLSEHCRWILISY